VHVKAGRHPSKTPIWPLDGDVASSALLAVNEHEVVPLREATHGWLRL